MRTAYWDASVAATVVAGYASQGRVQSEPKILFRLSVAVTGKNLVRRLIHGFPKAYVLTLA
jgi:hypothetical protein